MPDTRDSSNIWVQGQVKYLGPPHLFAHWHRLEELPLFLNDVLRLFFGAQSEEDGLTKLVIERPLGKLDLGDQHRFDPNGSNPYGT
jgi:hypothetical protein